MERMWSGSGMWAILATGLLLMGCSDDPCKPTRDAYKAAYAAEEALLPTSSRFGERVTHFGMAMHLELLNSVIEKALQTPTGELFNTHKEVKAAGQTVSFDAKARLSKMVLSAQPKCPNCVKIEGQVTGDLALDLPLIGKQVFPLQAPITLVTPLVFAEKDGGGVIQLDFKKMVSLGQSQLKLPVSSLPSPWNELLQAPVTNALLETVANRVGVVELYQFAPPDVGISNLKVVPTVLELNAQTGVMFVGLASNLPGIPAGQGGLKPLTVLGGSYNLGMGIHHQVLLPMVVSLLRSGEIPRTYTTDGKASPQGSVHLTISQFKVADAGKAPRGGNPFEMGFQLYNVPSSGICYSVDATATGKLKLKGGRVDMAIEGVRINKSSLPDVLNNLVSWAGAQFLSRSAQVVKSAIDPTKVGMPGGELEIASPLMMVKDSGMYVMSKASVTAEGQKGGAKDTGTAGSSRGKAANSGRAKAPPPRE